MKIENRIKDMIVDAGVKHPNNVALREIRSSKEQYTTYKQLENEVFKCAEKLKNVYGSRTKIGLYGENSGDWIKLYLSIIVSDNIVVPLDISMNIQELSNQLDKFKISLIIIDENMDGIGREMLEEKGIRTITYKEINYLEDEFTNLNDKYKVNENGCSVLYFTSGTTGEYKAVMLNQEQLMSDCKSLHCILNFESGSVFLNVLPFHHSFAIMCDILYGLYIGATICVSNLKKFTEELLYYSPKYIFAVPLIAENIFKYLENKDRVIGGNDKLETKKLVVGNNLESILCGGAIIKGELKEQLALYHINLIKGYGITECAPVVAVTSPQKTYSIDSVGSPLKCNSIKIKDGEILIEGGNVMLGYYDNVEETKKAFDGKWFKTGDLGYLDANNDLYITGRKKNLIILDNGENISAESLETKFGKYCSTKNLLVFEERSTAGKGMLSVVTFSDKSREDYISEEKIKFGINEFNKYEKVKTRISNGYSINATPVRTSTKKIRRKKSLELFVETIIFKKLVIILSDFLYEAQAINRDSDLYNDFGLDSFELHRLASVLEEHLGVEIAVNNIMCLSKIRDFVAYIASEYVIVSEISVIWKIKLLD